MKIITEHSDRWKTAAVLLLVVSFVGFMDSFFLTWLFLGVVYMVAFYEATKLFETSELKLFVYAASIWIAAGYYPHASDILLLALALFAGSVAYWRVIDTRGFMPLLYPTVGMLFVWMLYQEYHMSSLLWMLVIVALTDVGAFFVGKSIGKSKFCETSPNKTLEGVLGGIAAGTVIGAIVGAGLMEISFISALFISALASAISIFGDLFESYLKRRVGVKDSGNFLPGHGGALDRVDGYLFASIVIYVMLQAMGY